MYDIKSIADQGMARVKLQVAKLPTDAISKQLVHHMEPLPIDWHGEKRGIWHLNSMMEDWLVNPDACAKREDKRKVMDAGQVIKGMLTDMADDLRRKSSLNVNLLLTDLPRVSCTSSLLNRAQAAAYGIVNGSDLYDVRCNIDRARVLIHDMKAAGYIPEHHALLDKLDEALDDLHAVCAFLR